jgi:NADPH-dependent curcumin reductase CurA
VWLGHAVSSRARIQEFLVLDYQQRYQEAWTRLASWHREGTLKSRYDIVEDLESTPMAFLRLLISQNLDKQLVKVGDECRATS